MTMAEFMAQPTPMEKSVSTNSCCSLSCTTSSPCASKCWLWITSEWRNRLCGITTAPSTLITMASEPVGRLGVTHATADCAQSTLTRASSSRKDMPMSETNAMIQRSTRLYELLISSASDATATTTLPTGMGRPTSILRATAPPSTSAKVVATVAR